MRCTCGTEKYKIDQCRLSEFKMRNIANASSDASGTVTSAGSLDTRNGVRADTIGGAEPSTQNSGLRRNNFEFEVLLLLREYDVDDDEPLLEFVAVAESSSTGR
jgi:hypothetical protein